MKKYIPILFTFMVLSNLAAQDIKEYPGFMPFSYSAAKGTIALKVDQLDQEFLFVEGISSGIGSNDIGLDRGQIGKERIVKFIRSGNKLLMLQPNYGYRAISNNAAERNSVKEAFAQSVLWGFTIEKEENGIMTIDLTNFLMQDAHDIAGRLESTKQGSYKIDMSRSYINLERTKNFPDNTEFDAFLTFTGKATGGYIRSVTPSPEAVSVTQHLSFVRLPDNGYKKRVYDPRSGFFETNYFDYATPISEPLNKMLTVRHRLAKKDPYAAKSEAVQPIIYYMDPGCPEPIRSALMEGASWWNQAFEAAGYINGFQIKLLPPDADPMDVRFNTIQWVHRSSRGWSYGNTVTDPRTGEIIKGHVTLGSLRVRQDYMIAQGIASAFATDDQNTKPMTDMALARMRQLAAHEVGHTLGLNHNYASSYNDRASVMDYPHPIIQVVADQADFSNAYTRGIGEWDKRAIIWGYSDLSNSVDENADLNTIMQSTIDMGLIYITDADSRPAGSAHPYSHLWDNGNDPVSELKRIMSVRKNALNRFGLNSIRKGEMLFNLEDVLVPLYLSPRYQIEAASKMIGGVEYTYSRKGDNQKTSSMVPPDQQSNALNAILESISPPELALSERIIQLIPPPPPGYDRDRENFKNNTGLTFDPLAGAESLAGHALSFLIQKERLARIVEQNARDAGHISLLNYLNNLNNKLKSSSALNGMEQEIKLNTERIFINRVLSVLSDKTLPAIVSAPLLKFIYNVKSTTVSTTIQGNYILNNINKFLEDADSFEAPEPSRMPDGAPIGLMDCDRF